MKQILQSFKSGKTELFDVPAPKVQPGQILIKTSRSLVSLGTEKMLVEFGKASLIQKARQQPDKVKMVLDKIKSDGLFPTIESVFNKLEQPIPLGYCNVGKVIDVGKGVSQFKVGDRVASNGQHAEVVSVPQNLVVHIPDNVTDEEATFTVIASIGLQGIRLLNPAIGETVVVVGLGLIGLLSAEMLIANGCRVIGYDIDNNKVKIAKSKGVLAFNPTDSIDPVKFVVDNTDGIGADSVLITASSKTNDIISQVAKMSRKNGKIVLVGVIKLDLSRADFYEKELTFQVSCSYGPGRYDDDYELKGIDYPLHYVRWTEKRNFEAVLDLISTAKLNVKDLISDVIKLEDFNKIYGNISKSKSIASILKYEEDIKLEHSIEVTKQKLNNPRGLIAIIGAGNFTKMTLLPALKSTKADIKVIVSSGGVNGTSLAKKYNILSSSTDYDTVLNDKEIDLVIITTRHNLHKEMVIQALQKGKHVFVEKPLALNNKDLKIIDKVYKKSNGNLMVGFNRRFSPHIKKIRTLVEKSQINIVATMNAGFVPGNSWIHDLKIGGGRIIGEACHLIDIMVFISGSKIKSVCMNAMGNNPKKDSDNASILLRMENGSTGVLNYFSNGSKSYSKERIEIFSQQRVLVMDNYIKTTGFGFKKFKSLKTKQDKGHKSQFTQLVNKIGNGNIELIPYDEIINVTKASFAAIESLEQKKWIDII